MPPVETKASVAKKRYEIFKNFQKYVQKKDGRTMDEICLSGDTKFKLQAQQEFLREYMRTYPKWNRLLLFHKIGAGKTCTAITMAEEYLKTHPEGKIKVVLPARLRTNMLDELISPCGMNAYISEEDFVKYFDSKTSQKVKAGIKRKFMASIQEKYEIMSFEKFKALALKNGSNLQEWCREFTKDTMLIVDEVHNLLSDKYEPKQWKGVEESGEIKKGTKGLATLLFKYLAAHNHPSCKMVLLTATPIFDNVSQLKEVVQVMEPSVKDIAKKSKVSDVIDHLRGKVSYFPGTSANAYPSTEYNIHEVTISETQDYISNIVIMASSPSSEDETKEAFMSKQRQISIATLGREEDNFKMADNIREALRDKEEYCPKILELMESINENPGKHMVYSNFVESGLNIVKAALEQEGWVDFQVAFKNPPLWEAKKGKIFAVWDGSTKDADKQLVKQIVNARDNLYGDKIRVILGSPSVKEGVSFKHLQHMHMLDPVWNQSAKDQVEGRAIRFCSHVDIDEKEHAPLKRKVIIHIYKLMPRKGGLVTQTCDQKIYDEVIVNKAKLVKAAERALQKVAIDNLLFRSLYSAKPLPTPESTSNSVKSIVDLGRDNVFIHKQKSDNKIKANSCPKPRRPDDLGNCPEGQYKKLNAKGHECCYKMGKGKATTTSKGEATTQKTKNISVCPKGRAPPCSDGFYVKKNKFGVDCCFKKKVMKPKE